jgi:hypothetical protein
MKENKKKGEKVWDSLKPPTAEPLPAKEIKEKDGKAVKQYPPVVGHHGTDDEKELNPEE